MILIMILFPRLALHRGRLGTPLKCPQVGSSPDKAAIATLETGTVSQSAT